VNQVWVVLPILIPLAAVVPAFLLPRTAARITALLTAATTLTTALLLAHRVLSDGELLYELAGWGAPLGIDLRADGLSAFMVVMSSVVGAFATVYATSYFSRGRAREESYFWPLWMFLWAALNSLFLSGDVFNLYVALEVLGLASAALVTLPLGRAALAAGMRYLLVSLLGSLAYLLGVALLYGAFGTLDIALLGELMAPVPAAWAAIALISLGMALKTGLFPLHFWLPPAYSAAPAPASAILAGLVGKASFYLVLRLWFDAFGGAVEPVAGQLLGVLGAAAIVWGALMALRQRRLKMLLAYSSISQVGYLFVVFSLATATGWGFDAWGGSAYHALSHACAKAAAFMATGAIVQALGHDEISRMEGIAQKLPLAIASFAVAGITLMGLPPSGGFTAKWMLVSAAFQSGQWWLAAVLLAGGILAALYLLRLMNPALIYVPAPEMERYPARGLQVTAFVLAVLALFLGLFSAPLLELLRVGAPFTAEPILGGS
jgi:multicomponent Na+:H+ antiporter subunit D